MPTPWVRASTIALISLGTLAAAGSAWADAAAQLGSGQAPTTAIAFPVKGCDGSLGGGPRTDSDVWTFVLPDSIRQFVSLSAAFDTDGDGGSDVTLSIPASGGVGTGATRTKAWIVAPAGATLLGANGVTTGSPVSGQQFAIDRTCPAVPASATPQPSARPSPSRSASPRPRAKPVAAAAPIHSAASPSVEADSPSFAPNEANVLVAPSGQAVPVAASDSDDLSALPLIIGIGAMLAAIGSVAVLAFLRRGRRAPGRHRLG